MIGFTLCPDCERPYCSICGSHAGTDPCPGCRDQARRLGWTPEMLGRATKGMRAGEAILVRALRVGLLPILRAGEVAEWRRAEGTRLREPGP